VAHAIAFLIIGTPRDSLRMGNRSNQSFSDGERKRFEN